MNHDTPLPLDPAERELAEALARLPALEPPPQLDARVLATARAALRANQTTRHRKLRWLSAGFGSAAVAVLAAGIAWQAGLFQVIQSHDAALEAPLPPRSAADFETTAPTADQPAPAARPAPSVSPESERQQQARRAQEMERAAAAQAASANAARTHDAQRLETAPAPGKQEAKAPAPQAFPAPPPTVMQSPPPTPATAPPAPLPAPKQIERGQGVETTQDDLAPIPIDDATPMSVPVPPPPASAASDARAIRGGQDRVEHRTSLPAWQDDAVLAPDAWLERIGERLRQGDRAGAAASLRGFVAKHPATPVPAALAGLLDE